MMMIMCCDLSASMRAINILLFLYVVYTFQLKVDCYQRIPENSNFPGN